MDTQNYLTTAEASVDAGDFATACEFYRRAALQTPPSRRCLTSLTMAEDEERLQFRRELSARFPDHTPSRRFEALALISLKRPQQAFQIYTSMLARFPNVDSPDRIELLHLRFRAAILNQDWTAMVADFDEVWNSVREFPPAVALRPSLLESIAQLTSTSSIEALESLSEILPELQPLLFAKIAELRLLDDLRNEFSHRQHG